jgi:hypothetical protein
MEIISEIIGDNVGCHSGLIHQRVIDKRRWNNDRQVETNYLQENKSHLSVTHALPYNGMLASLIRSLYYADPTGGPYLHNATGSA